MGSPDDGEEPDAAVDAGQGLPDAAPAADAGEGAADAAPAVDAGADAMSPALDLDACDHMINGPSLAVEPAVNYEDDGQDVTPGHVRLDCGYVLGSSGYPYGIFDLVVKQPGKLFVYHPHLDITIRFSDGRGVVDAESEQPVTCGDTTLNRHAFDLDAGTYKLGYGSFYDPLRLVLLMEGDTGH